VQLALVEPGKEFLTHRCAVVVGDQSRTGHTVMSPRF
jgi:hypothetical protein